MNKADFKDKFNEAIIGGELDLAFFLLDHDILYVQLDTTVIDASVDVLVIHKIFQITLDEPFYLIQETTISRRTAFCVRERWFEGAATTKIVYTPTDEL